MENIDPRIYFAAERTLLAWVRTGLTVIGLGFVVARFGLFLRAIHNNLDADPHAGSVFIGVGLVLLGAVATGMAAWQHVRFCRNLRPADRPQHYTISWSVWFAVILSIVSAALAGYILIRSNVA